MDTVSFYESVLPAIGMRALAVFKGGLGSPPTQTFYDNNDDLWAAAESFDKLGKNVYHGCASYKNGSSRKATNVEAVKSLWVDLDVGPKKPYQSLRDAAAQILRFTQALGLPAPHMVKSGGGLHVYYPFTKAINGEQWQRLAAAFAACLNHFGVQHDSSRTEDVASILRVPGTNNYKTDTPREVRVISFGQDAAVAVLYRAFKAYADTNGVLLLGKPAPSTKATNDLVGEAPTYPPSIGENIAGRCPTLEEVAETGGDVSYEIWWRAIGVAKHTTEPATVAAFWTRDRASTGHTKYDWQTTMDEWEPGPTTCKEFSKHSAKCATCKHNGTISSPIQLGYDEQPVIETIVPKGSQLQGRTWEFGADWIMDEIGRRTRTGYSNGQMTMLAHDENGTPKHVPFCNRYWQVMNRVRTMDGIWQLEIAYEVGGGQAHKTFLLESASVTSPDLLRKAFSARELHIFGGNKGMLSTQEIIRAEQDFLYSGGQEMVTYPAMGWVTVDDVPRGNMTGQFVLGNTLIQPRTPPTRIKLDEAVSTSLQSAFETAGTTAEWVRLVDKIYNRVGAEAYQFLICAMFAAPLVRLTSSGSTFHGIPIAVTGDSGAAKTTTAKVAMSIYTRPDGLLFNGNMEKGGQGDTLYAFTAKIGMLQNLPFVADEMTQVEPDTLAKLMWTIPQGQGRDRMGPNGKLIPNPYRWDTTSIVTGNEGFHEKLKMLSHQQTQEATQIRCFQIQLMRSDLETTFSDVTKSMVDDELLAKNYGCVGVDWLQKVVNNRPVIQDMLGHMRKVYKIDDNDNTAIRFYKDLLMVVECAGTLAKRWKFVNFDVQAMVHWAKSQIVQMRDQVAEQDWDGKISDFVASLHGRTIVTKHMKLGPGRRGVQEMPMEFLTSNTMPVARKAIDDRLFFVTANALKEWAKENKVMPSSLVNQMVERGYIISRAGEKVAPKMVNVGGGTTVTRPQAPCWELDFTKVAEGAQAPTGAGGNVVPLHSATEAVTDQDNEAAAS